MFDIQTDPSFPAFAVDAEPKSLQAEEMMMRQNEVADILVQYPPTSMTDVNGKVVIVLGQEQGEGGSSGVAWGLAKVAGKWELTPGRIFTSPSGSRETRITLAKTPVTIQAGGAVWIEFTVVGNELFAEIKSGGKWYQHPNAYQIDATKTPHAIQFARFALWEFVSGKAPATEPEAVAFPGDIYGVPTRRSSSLYITWGAAPNTTNIPNAVAPIPRRYLVPVLLAL